MKKKQPSRQNKIGNHAQIDSIETLVLDNGLYRVIQIAWSSTRFGRRGQVVVDRVPNIVEAVHNRYGLAQLYEVTVLCPEVNTGITPQLRGSLIHGSFESRQAMVQSASR